jgi:asparagine synthase (glutamine-hydrolysing)
MCGISVIYSPESLDIDKSYRIVKKQLDIMHSRGPDASRIIKVDSRLVLGHNRLAIIGLEPESDQPMLIEDSYHIVFNGEIYNYKKIKDELIALGEKFITSSDTEVILRGYKIFGVDIFCKLKGMFAVIIFDKLKQELIVSRDSFGIKPLYVHRSKDNTFAFSSSVKALKETIDFNFSLNKQSKLLFEWFGFIPEPQTVYNDINAVEAGTTYIYSVHGVQVTSRKDKLENIYLNNQDANYSKNSKKTLVENISFSINAHLVSDVPLSIFLSSGIDSNLIAYLAKKKHNSKLFAQTLSVNSLTGSKYDEEILAKKTASKLGLDINIKRADSKLIKEDSENILKIMDQPSVDGLNIYMLSKEVKAKKFKVSLVGTGADELLCGYSFYNSLPYIHHLRMNIFFKFMSKKINGAFKSTKLLKLFDTTLPCNDILDSYILQRSLRPPSSLLERYSKDEIIGAHKYIRNAIGTNVINSRLNIRSKLMFFDQNFYLKNQLLRDCDWASMSHSIEIRTPFVDKDILEFVLTNNLSHYKNIKKYIAKNELINISSDFVKRKKTGFAIPDGSKSFNQNDYSQSLRDKQDFIYEIF